MGFAEQLRKYREQKGIEQKELSRMIGRSKGTISNYENHVSTPKMDDMLKIIEILDIEPNQLFWDDIPETMRERIKKECGLNEHDAKLLAKYNNRPEMQSAVDTLLGIEHKSKSISDDITEELNAAKVFSRHTNTKSS